MAYEKEIDHFVTESEEVVGLKDSIARKAHYPFERMRAKLIVQGTVATDEDGNLPSQVVITQRDDGTPLNLKAFALETDCKSNVSYSVVSFGDDPSWYRQGKIFAPHGAIDQRLLIFLDADGYVISTGGSSRSFCYFPYGAGNSENSLRKGDSGTVMKWDTIERINIPGSFTLDSGTYYKVWEITLDNEEVTTL